MRTIHWMGGQFTAASATRYYPYLSTLVGGGSDATVENNCKTTIHVPCVVSNLRTNVNAVAGAIGLYFKLRKNNADSGLGIFAPQFATGEYFDGTQVTVADGDTLDFMITDSGSTTSTVQATTTIDPTDQSQSLFSIGIARSPTYSTASQTNYAGFGRPSSAEDTTESNAQMYIPTGCTGKNLLVNIFSNARSSTTTVTSRKNGSDGNLTVSIGASATGTFEDTSNSDTISAADLYNTKVVTGTGTGNLVVNWFRIDLLFPTNAYMEYTGSHRQTTVNAGVTWYGTLGMGDTFFTNNPPVSTDYQHQEAVSLFTAVISSNANSTAATFDPFLGTTLVSGYTLSIAAGATGVFTSTAPPMIIPGITSEIYWRIISGATGAIVFRTLSMMMVPTNAPPSLNVNWAIKRAATW